MPAKRFATGLLLLLCSHTAMADRLVFGSFRSSENAVNWAAKLTAVLGQPISAVDSSTGPGYRVISDELDEPALRRLARQAETAGIEFWRLIDVDDPAPASAERSQQPSRLSPPTRITRSQTKPAQTPPAQAPAQVPAPVDTSPPVSEPATRADTPLTETAPTRTPVQLSDVRTELEWELGLQGRWFAYVGFDGQSRTQGSFSLAPEYYRSWQGDRQSFTFAPFVRVDSLDDERTHADIRELFYSYVGESWDIHVGAKRIFWGVTEFSHLIDIVNQTDLVENIDTEDKLGQPMVQLSTVQDWGIVDIFVLTGFRERTFASLEGRLNLPFAINDDAIYESGAQELRTDLAARWSHHLGPFAVGVHHFSGTSREPLLLPQLVGSNLQLQPYYPVIEQTGLDLQAIFGDWAFKLEGFSRGGFDDRYAAANIGVERTLVGVLGSAADFGVVAEYMFDERGDDAFNTLFENDIALGGRLALNDFANTQALFGVIVDADRREYVWSLEASRQLGSQWQLNLEGRVFAGGRTLRPANVNRVLFDPEFKSAFLQQEDYLQVEFVRFF